MCATIRSNSIARWRAICSSIGRFSGRSCGSASATGIQVVTVSIAELAIISFVNHYGARATAAYGAVNQIVSYVQFPAISIGIAASIFGAQCIGRKREDKLGSVMRSAVGLNYVIGGVLILTVYLLAVPLLQLFITDAQTVSIAHGLLRSPCGRI